MRARIPGDRVRQPAAQRHADRPAKDYQRQALDQDGERRAADRAEQVNPADDRACQQRRQDRPARLAPPDERRRAPRPAPGSSRTAARRRPCGLAPRPAEPPAGPHRKRSAGRCRSARPTPTTAGPCIGCPTRPPPPPRSRLPATSGLRHSRVASATASAATRQPMPSPALAPGRLPARWAVTGQHGRCGAPSREQRHRHRGRSIRIGAGSRPRRSPGPAGRRAAAAGRCAASSRRRTARTERRSDRASAATHTRPSASAASAAGGPANRTWPASSTTTEEQIAITSSTWWVESTVTRSAGSPDSISLNRSRCSGSSPQQARRAQAGRGRRAAPGPSQPAPHPARQSPDRTASHALERGDGEHPRDFRVPPPRVGDLLQDRDIVKERSHLEVPVVAELLRQVAE